MSLKLTQYSQTFMFIKWLHVQHEIRNVVKL